MEIAICDVGPRDGLQNDSTTLSPETRADLCVRLAESGLRRVEAGSFVNPKRVPQMAGRRGGLRGHRAGAGRHVLRARAEWARPGARAGDGRGGDPPRLSGHRHVRGAQPGHDARGGCERHRADDRECDRRGHTRDRHAGRVVRLPVRGPGRSWRGDRARAAHGDAGADEIMLADTIGVGVPSRCASSCPRHSRPQAASPSAYTCTTPATPATPTHSRGWSTARRCSTPRSAASAAARSRRTPPATSPPRT